MATIYDLSVSLRTESMETMELAFTMATHEEAARLMARRHRLKVSDFPGRSFFAAERVRLRTHVGTHLDAPVHFYPTSAGQPAKCIDELPLEWCMGNAVRLDFRDKTPSEPITEYDIAGELERLGYEPKRRDIVLTWTGGTDRYDDDPRFAESAAGMNGGALNYLFRFGVQVMGTDSHTMDMPIPLMTERLLKGDRASYFPVHRAGRLTEWTHAEKLAHLGDLPEPFGFKVMFFPIKVARGTGAWIRAVAVEDPWLSANGIRPIDLSLPIMNQSFELEESRIIRISRDQGLRAKAKRLGLPVSDVIHSGANDEVDTHTQAGTHIVGPYHFGPVVGGRRARTIEELPLDWFYGDGVLLDFSREKSPGGSISLEDVRTRLDEIGHHLKGGNILLLKTGAADCYYDDPAFVDLSPGLDVDALHWILDSGVRVIGTDAESMDGPVGPMFENLRAGDSHGFFPIRYAGREREFCLLEKMDLGGLSIPLGFKIAAFPIKLEGCGAAWTRAVALVPQPA